jgi:hypothetical protein
VLRLDALLATAEFCAGAARFERIQDLFHVLQPVNSRVFARPCGGV